MRNTPTEKQKALARGKLEGKSFRQAALDAGYSKHVARGGLKQYLADSPGTCQAFLDVANNMEIPAEQFRKVIKYRLFDSIVQGKPSKVSREIELAGGLKELDMFVRSGEIQIGVFANIADDRGSQVLDLVSKTLSSESTGLVPSPSVSPEPEE